MLGGDGVSIADIANPLQFQVSPLLHFSLREEGQPA